MTPRGAAPRLLLLGVQRGLRARRTPPAPLEAPRRRLQGCLARALRARQTRPACLLAALQTPPAPPRRALRTWRHAPGRGERLAAPAAAPIAACLAPPRLRGMARGVCGWRGRETDRRVPQPGLRSWQLMRAEGRQVPRAACARHSSCIRKAWQLHTPPPPHPTPHTHPPMLGLASNEAARRPP